jgi:glycosyltransferase involved in cell wall biosynthesis
LHSAGLGGAERSALELVQGLIKAGVTINCVLPIGQEELSKLLKTAGARVETLTNLSWWTYDPISAIQETVAVQTLLENLESDLVITITGVIPQGAIAARKLGIPHIWFLHEFFEADHGLKFPFSKEIFTRLVLEFSEKVICNSNSVKEYFFAELSEKVVTIKPFPQNMNFGETHKFRQLSKPLVLGLVANFSPGKGHLILLSAVAKLTGVNLEVSVKFFGDDGTPEYRNQIDNFINENSLQEKVSFQGFVSSRKEIFDSIDVVIVPSTREAFGRVPFEAMSYGVPVIYSESGALVEYMKPDVTGIPFKVNDSSSLAEAIIKIAESQLHYSHLIRNGQAYAREISENENYIKDVLDICIVAAQTQKKQSLSSDIAILIEKFSEVTQQHDEVLNSTIWRTTKVLRIFSDFFRR